MKWIYVIADANMVKNHQMQSAFTW